MSYDEETSTIKLSIAQSALDSINNGGDLTVKAGNTTAQSLYKSAFSEQFTLTSLTVVKE